MLAGLRPRGRGQHRLCAAIQATFGDVIGGGALVCQAEIWLARGPGAGPKTAGCSPALGCQDQPQGDRARLRSIGTLGSGNLHPEIQVVHPEYVYDAALAQQFGIRMPEQVVVMFHCESRGFGHQVTTDKAQIFRK